MIADSGDETRAIKGEDIPNPSDLWDKRKAMYPDVDAESLKPQMATFSLWEHYHGQ